MIFFSHILENALQRVKKKLERTFQWLKLHQIVDHTDGGPPLVSVEKNNIQFRVSINNDDNQETRFQIQCTVPTRTNPVPQ